MKEDFKIRSEKIEKLLHLRKKYIESEKNLSEDLENDLIEYLDCLQTLTDFEMNHYLICLYGD